MSFKNGLLPFVSILLPQRLGRLSFYIVNEAQTKPSNLLQLLQAAFKNSFSEKVEYVIKGFEHPTNLVKVLDGTGQQRGDELEGGRGKAVGSARVGVDVVPGEVAHVLQVLEEEWNAEIPDVV